MKSIFFSFLLVATVHVSAQNTSAPEGSLAGYIISNTNEKSEGFIRESFKKGGILFTSSGGDKKTYTPSEITAFTLGSDSYTTYLNDFYKVVSTGSRGSLLQKVTNNTGKMVYNGTEAYPLTTTEGKPGDYYLRIKASDKVALVTKKNFETVFASFCADCTALQTSIQGKQVDYTTITKAVEQYNSCD